MTFTFFVFGSSYTGSRAFWNFNLHPSQINLSLLTEPKIELSVSQSPCGVWLAGETRFGKTRHRIYKFLNKYAQEECRDNTLAQLSFRLQGALLRSSFRYERISPPFSEILKKICYTWLYLFVSKWWNNFGGAFRARFLHWWCCRLKSLIFKTLNPTQQVGNKREA